MDNKNMQTSGLKPRELRPLIADNITQLIGNTPLLRLNNITKDSYAQIVVKLEKQNPWGSVKDRIGLFMIEEAEKQGLINSETVIIEPTSGNTGIGLAGVAASKGYKIIIVMPDNMSIERRKLIAVYGAEVVLTPRALGMNGAIKKAEELAIEYPNSFIPQQFTNSANPKAHENTTAVEIWEDTEGKVDFVVAGVGTGGTITGIARALKKLKPSIKIVAVEPEDSAVLSGCKSGTHLIQGIGAGFVPDVLDVKVLDEIIPVPNDDAFKTATELSIKEAVPAGISGGAAVFAGLKIAARKENEGKMIIVILPDGNDRYLSTSLFDYKEKPE